MQVLQDHATATPDPAPGTPTPSLARAVQMELADSCDECEDDGAGPAEAQPGQLDADHVKLVRAVLGCMLESCCVELDGSTANLGNQNLASGSIHLAALLNELLAFASPGHFAANCDCAVNMQLSGQADLKKPGKAKAKAMTNLKLRTKLLEVCSNDGFGFPIWRQQCFSAAQKNADIIDDRKLRSLDDVFARLKAADSLPLSGRKWHRTHHDALPLLSVFEHPPLDGSGTRRAMTQCHF